MTGTHYKTLLLRLSIAMTVVLFVGLMTVSLAVAESVRIRVTENGNSGRIVFNWEIPVSYRVNMSGRQLVVSFSKVIDADLAVIQRAMPRYVSRVQRGEDGRSVIMSLSDDFILAHYPTGTSILVELSGGTPVQASLPPAVTSESAPEPTSDPEPQAVSQETSQAQSTTTAADVPTDIPVVNVRTGRHSDKLRVVFDWARKVPYSVERKAGVLRIVFAKPAAISTQRLTQAMPSLIGDVRSLVQPSQTEVSMAIAPGAEVKNFYAGTKIVVDILFPSDGSVPGKLPEQETQKQVEVSQSEPPELPVALDAESEKASETQKGTPEENTPTQLTTDSETTQHPYDPNKPYEGDSSLEAGEMEGGFVFRFAWEEPSGAVVFRRGGALWMIFDKPADVDVGALRKVAGDGLLDLIQLGHPDAVILRAITAKGINPSLQKDGLTWLIEFRSQSFTTQTPVEALAQPDSPVGARVFLPVLEPRAAIAITDPEIGDNFVVVPLAQLGYGVNHLYKYPQFRIRPSSQGIVIEPAIDSLQIRPVDDGVSIASSQIFHISAVSEADMARARADSYRELSRIVDFDSVLGLTDQFYNVDRQDFEHAIVEAGSKEEKVKTRLDLARFLLAHGYAPEALGVLKVAADLEPSVLEAASFYVYVGIADWMLNRFDEAASVLGNELLDDNDEGAFWRSLVAFLSGDESDEVIRGIRSTGLIPSSYPRILRVPLLLETIRATIIAQDFDYAREQVELLSGQDLSDKNRSKLLYLSGKLNEADGKDEAALADWDKVREGSYEPAVVKAALAYVKMQLRLNRTSRHAALLELEKLRYIWRGGDFEFKVLRELGNVYLELGAYRQGLETLRQAASYFRKREDAIDVTQQMSDVFSELFLEGRADDMLPFVAIALYDEFKELTPAGRLGDEMIRKLADRLVGVDLLEEAAMLLDSQVRLRLKGVDKTRVGAQLAVIWSLSKDYEKALDALDISAAEDVPEQLEIQRLHLKARALAGTGDELSAVVLLEDDETREAEQLRADIYRTMKDWGKAARSLSKLIGMTGAKPNVPLTPEQAKYILSYAIALTLGNNDRGLVRLRSQFSSSMQQTELADAFRLISYPEQFGLVNYTSIAGKVKVAERFSSFMTSYRERLQSGEALSSIN